MVLLFKFEPLSQFIPDSNNELFRLAVQLVNESSRNIFLTGKAGTGKTTFLKHIRENCLKQMAVVAPTGVAAINAGGVTIHSFFQLPFSPFLPSGNGGNESVVDKHELLKRLRFNSEKRKVLQQLELLIIDEISMVRCDTLDAIDAILRYVRKRSFEAFGGVQVLFIGDMMQLPPVIKDDEWNLLSEHYTGPYFFNSQVISTEMPVHIEFEKIYRQTEEKFIGVLNQVRNNRLDEDGLAILESRYDPGFKRIKGDGYIVLTTHNEKARQINNGELNSIPGASTVYEAKIEDEFSERAYPADEKLELKAGAQVMFIRNDSSDRGRRYFNGKIGVVTRLEKDKIFVSCEGEETDIEVQPEKWENIRYTVDPVTRKLDQKLLGSFTQFPLRLAWAITIHKSQGLTFDKAIIDAGSAFVPGQVYVALSRCTNLDGLILQTRINPSSLLSDRKLLDFSERQASSQQLEEEFALAKKKYQLKLLVELFDTHSPIQILSGIREGFIEYKASCNAEALPWADNLLEKLRALQGTAKKFFIQLESLLMSPGESDDGLLKERIQAASVYFCREFNILMKLIEFSPVVTDSYVHAREFNDELKDLYAGLASRKFVLEKNDLLNIDSIQRNKKNFRLSNFRVNAYSANADQKFENDHPELYARLKQVRDEICRTEGLPVYFVANSNSLKEMTRYLPRTEDELKMITGFGTTRVNKFGSKFLEPIIDYAQENGLESLIHQKEVKKGKKRSVSEKKTKPDTKMETLRLIKEGKSPDVIASERSLAVSTIESHICHFIETGELGIEKFLDPAKISLVDSAIEKTNGSGITSIKEKLGNAASFGEIRMVIAGRMHRNKPASEPEGMD